MKPDKTTLSTISNRIPLWCTWDWDDATESHTAWDEPSEAPSAADGLVRDVPHFKEAHGCDAQGGTSSAEVDLCDAQGVTSLCVVHLSDADSGTSCAVNAAHTYCDELSAAPSAAKLDDKHSTSNISPGDLPYEAKAMEIYCFLSSEGLPR